MWLGGLAGAQAEAWLSSDRLRGDLGRLDHVLAGLPGQGTRPRGERAVGSCGGHRPGRTETPAGRCSPVPALAWAPSLVEGAVSPVDAETLNTSPRPSSG